MTSSQDTTCCLISDVRSWGLDTAYQRSWKQHIQCLNDSLIPGTTRGCPVTAALWWDCPALVSSVHCPPYDPLLRLTWSLAGDWLTTRQHNPHSSSHWDQNILVATKEHCWEEDSTGQFQVPDFKTHPQAAKTQPGPVFHHTSQYNTPSQLLHIMQVLCGIFPVFYHSLWKM